MKKLTGIILCLTMLFSTSGCSGSKIDDKALDALDAAMASVSKLDSTDYALSLLTSANGTEMELDGGGTYIKKDKKPQFSLLVKQVKNKKASELAQAYYNEGVIYYNLQGVMKQKLTLNLESLASMAMANVKPAAKKNIALKDSGIKDYLKNATIEKGVISLEFDVDKLNEYAKKQSKKSTGTQLDMISGMLQTNEVNNVTFEVATKDKMLKSVIIDLESKTGGKKNKFHFELFLKNINTAKDIAYPDFTEYLEATGLPALGE